MHRTGNEHAIDRAHALLFADLFAAHKPSNVLELGVGSVYLTRIVLAALAEKRGLLVVVKEDGCRLTLAPITRVYLFWRDRIAPGWRRMRQRKSGGQR